MKKLTKIKLSAELLEAAADSVRTAALDKIRWSDDYHLECEDRWSDAELLSKLTPAGDEILEVAEELAARIEEMI